MPNKKRENVQQYLMSDEDTFHVYFLNQELGRELDIVLEGKMWKYRAEISETVEIDGKLEIAEQCGSVTDLSDLTALVEWPGGNTCFLDPLFEDQIKGKKV